MGCDIHLAIEYSYFNDRDGTPYWVGFGGRINPGRDYLMFNAMAGVRGDSITQFEPRGKPAGHISYTAENMLSPYNEEMDEHVDDTDLHSLSWLTDDEYAQCYAVRMLSSEYGPPGVPWEVLLVTLNAFKERGLQCRVVFAFDN